MNIDLNNKIATRDSYGKALAELGAEFSEFVVLDADLAGATKTGMFGKVSISIGPYFINCN